MSKKVTLKYAPKAWGKDCFGTILGPYSGLTLSVQLLGSGCVIQVSRWGVTYDC